MSLREKRTAIVVVFSAIVMVLEIIVGHLTGSMALKADGIHMGSHVLVIGLSWCAYAYVRRLSHKQQTDLDSGKILSLAAFTSGVLLLVFAVFILIETVERVVSPVAEISYREAMAVALVGLVVNSISAYVLHDKHHDDDLNSHSAYLHVMADALTSIGAIFGLICAMIWHITWVDTAVAFLMALVIIKWAAGLLSKTARQLTTNG